MDLLDWVTYIAGGGLVFLTGALGFLYLSGAAERDITPLWGLGFVVCGVILGGSLVWDRLFPIDTIVYVANGGTTPRQVRIGDEVRCLPGKSYDDFRWRFGAPDAVIVGAGAGNARYPIGKGTWFINTAPQPVSADMYYGSDRIDNDAVTANSSGAIHIDSHYGRPVRMFSQLNFDRVYGVAGDVVQRSDSGACPVPSAARPGG
jgi:hypothetical protein